MHDSPASTSSVLELQGCATTPGYFVFNAIGVFEDVHTELLFGGCYNKSAQIVLGRDSERAWCGGAGRRP
jgi:hypothetical protein